MSWRLIAWQDFCVKDAGMRVVISGAGGPLGQILIPVLSQDGVDILLMDEDPDRLKLLYPSLAVRT